MKHPNIHSSPTSARSPDEDSASASAHITDKDSAPRAGDDFVPPSDGRTVQQSGGGSGPHQDSPTSDAPFPNNGATGPVNDV